MFDAQQFRPLNTDPIGRATEFRFEWRATATTDPDNKCTIRTADCLFRLIPLRAWRSTQEADVSPFLGRRVNAMSDGQTLIDSALVVSSLVNNVKVEKAISTTTNENVRVFIFVGADCFACDPKIIAVGLLRRILSFN